jgi:hypothetical protein
MPHDAPGSWLPRRDDGPARPFVHALVRHYQVGFNGLFKNVFEWRTQMPVQGLQRSQLLALGAIVIYQLVLLYQHEHNLPLDKGIKPLVRAA